jgi:hypothetical protein
MLGIAGHEVMRCGSLRAFQKYVVVWVGADTHPLGGLYPNAAIADCAQYGCNFAIASIKPGAADDFFVFRKNIPAYAQLMSGSRMVIRNTCAGCPCGLSRAEIRMLVSRTTRIIAPGAVDDYAVPFAQRLFPRRSLRQKAGRAPPALRFPRIAGAIPGQTQTPAYGC